MHEELFKYIQSTYFPDKSWEDVGAQLMKDGDKFEMAVQTLHEDLFPDKDYTEFSIRYKQKFGDPFATETEVSPMAPTLANRDDRAPLLPEEDGATQGEFVAPGADIAEQIKYKGLQPTQEAPIVPDMPLELAQEPMSAEKVMAPAAPPPAPKPILDGALPAVPGTDIADQIKYRDLQPAQELDYYDMETWSPVKLSRDQLAQQVAEMGIDKFA